MVDFQKISLIACLFLNVSSFGQVIKKQNSFTFKQNWMTKKDYVFSAYVSIENVKKDKKSLLFSMASGYRVHPTSYKNNILTASLENFSTKKKTTIQVDTLKGVLISKKAPSVLPLLTGIWPQKSVKVGDKWTLKAQDLGRFSKFFEDKSIFCTYYFKGIVLEKFNKIPCAKIELKINEALNKELKGSGEALIYLKDGLLNRLELNLVHSLSKPNAEGVTQHLLNATIKQGK